MTHALGSQLLTHACGLRSLQSNRDMRLDASTTQTTGAATTNSADRPGNFGASMLLEARRMAAVLRVPSLRGNKASNDTIASGNRLQPKQLSHRQQPADTASAPPGGLHGHSGTQVGRPAIFALESMLLSKEGACMLYWLLPSQASLVQCMQVAKEPIMIWSWMSS